MTNLRTDADSPETYRNRGRDTQAEESSNISVSLVDIDTAIIKYMDDVIQPFVTQDELKVSVPILYANPERWKSTRKDGVFRDVRGKLQIPLIMIKRDSIILQHGTLETNMIGLPYKTVLLPVKDLSP